MVRGEKRVCFEGWRTDRPVLKARAVSLRALGRGRHACAFQTAWSEMQRFSAGCSAVLGGGARNRVGWSSVTMKGEGVLLAFTGCTRESKYPAGCKAVLTDDQSFGSKCQSLYL